MSKNDTKLKLKEILTKMKEEYSLSNLCEFIENETGGKFTFLTLREIIDKLYQNLPQSDKIFLLKNLSLKSLGISKENPLIHLTSLFNFFNFILDETILAPSLFLYKVADILENKFKISTMEFMYKLNLNLNDEININKFYELITFKLGLDQISSIVLFKCLDYKKRGKIIIEDLILVLDSYRADSYSNNENVNDNETEKNALLLKMFLDKNYITIDYLFEDAEFNYLYYDDLKRKIMKEINNANQLNNNQDANTITEKTVDSVLVFLSKNDKIFKDSFKEFLPKFTNPEKKSSFIILNEIQKYWINKFLEMIASVSITPSMIFESAQKNKNLNVINLEDLKRQLKILLPSGRINQEEANNIMDSFDINKTRLIERNQFFDVINQIQNEKKTLENLSLNNNYVNPPKKNINLWKKGVKSTNYHLLPVKGNYKVLESLIKEIEKNLYFDNKNPENQQSLFFKEKSLDQAENAAIFEEQDEKTGKKTKIYQNKINENENQNEFEDEYNLIKSLENFNYEKNIFPCFDLFNDLVMAQNFPKNFINKLIKFLDTDKDGFISIINIINFLLHQLKHRSTKLLLKFLFNKIYKEFKLNSSEDFIIKNNIDLFNQIYVNDLCKFLNKLSIDFSLSKKLFDEMINIFPSPVTYKNFCELIDENKNDSLFKNYLKNSNNLIDMKTLENAIKKIIFGIIDDENYISNDYLKAKNLRENLKTILDNCDDVMNLHQYNINFAKPLEIEPLISLTIFQLLKNISPSGEQLIAKVDLIAFLESYVSDSDEILEEENDDDENKIHDLIVDLEKNGPSIKTALENVPFNKNGYVTVAELKRTLNEFYDGALAKNNLMRVINDLDPNKTGIISYDQIEMFIYEFCLDKNNKFSLKLEIKYIASNILQSNFNSANDYFNDPKFQSEIENYNNITKEENRILLKDVGSSNKNKDELFDELCKKCENKNGYNIDILCDLINGYIIEFIDYEDFDEDFYEENEEKIEMIPDKKIVEEMMRNIGIGSKGKVAMYEILKNLKNENRKSIVKIIDKKKRGFVEFSKLINKLREFYGTEINLNYKLCAQYVFKVFINKPELIDDYILSKFETDDINNYVTKKTLYSKFMFAFANDKFLFETFYTIFKEKKGQNEGNINLQNLSKFIKMNNPEAKNLLLKKSNINESIESKENPSINIRSILTKKNAKIRNIIEKINVRGAKLKKDGTIKEDYLKTLLSTKFNFNEDEIDDFLNFFRKEESRFDVFKLFNFDPNHINQRNFIMIEEILPKIKESIEKSPFKSYKLYIKNVFDSENEFFDIVEVYEHFSKLYLLNLFECLVCLNNSDYLLISKFFNENGLKEIFPQKEIDSSLKLAVHKLNDYFNKNKDKLKIFKNFDLDKNGVLSRDEFITALNSFKDLNLNDAQKISLLKIADKNKDGKIQANEFLSFVKNIKNMDKNEIKEEEKSNVNNLPNIMKSNMIKNSSYLPKIIQDNEIIKESLLHNKKCLINNKIDFLNYIIILQEDLIKNFNNSESIEQDFFIADSNKKGTIQLNKFSNILKKRLFIINKENFEKFVDLANEGLSLKKKEKLNEISEIDYTNFLNNLVAYKFENLNKSNSISQKSKNSKKSNKNSINEEEEKNSEMQSEN